MDKNKLDQETEGRMRPMIDKWKISAESLEREFESTESPWKFLLILNLFSFRATPDSKDTRLNALFLDGIRNGKWSPIYSHPLFSTKWLMSTQFSQFDNLPTPLLDIVKEAHREIVVKFEQYRLGQNPSESMKRPAPLWLSVSFVRHGESQSNAGSSRIMDPQLTSRGRYQAAALGKHQKVEKEIFVELDLGAEVKALLIAGRSDEAHSLRTDNGRAVQPTSVRRRHRTPGGESQEDAARRAQLALLHLIFDHGVQLVSPPEQASDDSHSWDGTLIDGIPHLVVVGHNLFLSELFESLKCWEAATHVETMVYRNAGWTRHLLRLDWPGDEDEDYNLNSYQGFWFGLRLKNWYKMGL
ncbi:hypothetical protein BDN71DRAFT_1586787 [Pleurotus eryngii]|uniref:Uncharacterized protein n=1 Tax=Pleurotus eryngii TaxID=5323 RepID=A0A9P6A5D6_PLEER|nr:hypothetical protein BDN71DRAFT_1586787 [Pleurotus eryngii]